MVSAVTCAWPVQGGWNSGRKVISTRTGSCRTRSTSRPRSSRVEGSIQCTSSYSASTGCCAARPASCSTRAFERPLLLPLRASGSAPDSARRSGPRAGRRAAARPRPAGRSTGRAAPPAWRAAPPAASSRSKPRRPLQQADHRIERAVGVVGRAVMAERRVRLVAQPLAQRPDQARLADPGLARRAAPPGRRRPWPRPSARAGCRARARARPAASDARRAAPRSGPRRGPRRRPARRRAARRSP